jgi:hypothetical protein
MRSHSGIAQPSTSHSEPACCVSEPGYDRATYIGMICTMLPVMARYLPIPSPSSDRRYTHFVGGPSLSQKLNAHLFMMRHLLSYLPDFVETSV